jgi:hypothetical protein
MALPIITCGLTRAAKPSGGIAAAMPLQMPPPITTLEKNGVALKTSRQQPS